jgi:DNA-binding transcriptional MerR regulator
MEGSHCSSVYLFYLASFFLDPIACYKVYAVGMRIGEVSKQSGVAVGTIRFYERRKLLKPPQRTASGYRSYAPQDVQVLKGIRAIQELGFTLKEVKELLDLHNTAACAANNRGTPRGVQRMILLTEEKLQNIEKKMQLLRHMRKDVAQMLDALRTQAEKACPVAREIAQERCPGKR